MKILIVLDQDSTNYQMINFHINHVKPKQFLNLRYRDLTPIKDLNSKEKLKRSKNPQSTG